WAATLAISVHPRRHSMTETSAGLGDDLSRLDTSVAHSARLWNYLLGGKDNFAADREAAQQVLAFMPELVESARANREFLARVVRFLTQEARIEQFLDLGTGLDRKSTRLNSSHLGIS